MPGAGRKGSVCSYLKKKTEFQVGTDGGLTSGKGSSNILSSCCVYGCDLDLGVDKYN